MQPEVTTATPNGLTEQWAILEIMGHERLAGRISEVLVAGAKMLQVEVPATDKLPGFTRLLSPTALFSLTPVPEQVATIVAGNLSKTAVSGIAAYGYTTGQQLEMRQALGLPAPKESAPAHQQLNDYECDTCGRTIGPADGCRCESDPDDDEFDADCDDDDQF